MSWGHNTRGTSPSVSSLQKLRAVEFPPQTGIQTQRSQYLKALTSTLWVTNQVCGGGGGGQLYSVRIFTIPLRLDSATREGR